MKRRRIRITAETERLLVIRRPARSVRAWCSGCGAEAFLITPEEAARVIGGKTRTVYRRVEAGMVHFQETSAGTLFVCLNSLLKDDQAVLPGNPAR